MNNNYILITIDCLRADHLNLYGYEKRITSPSIDHFAEHSDVYLNAFACGTPTFLSFPSIFCSIYPSKAMRNMYLPKNIPTLVELLKKRNFRTAAFIDNNPFCSSLLGYNRGFEFINDSFKESPRKRIRIKLDFSPDSKIIRLLNYLKLRHFVSYLRNLPSLRYLISTKWGQPKTNTEQMLHNAIKFIKSAEESFFVWLHLMDVHWPYPFPDYKNPLMKYKVLKVRRCFCSIPVTWAYDEEIPELLEEMYDEGIKRLDAKLGGFFNSLQRERILDNTYVFITSDHGQENLERGITFDHQVNVYQEITHVPLIIKKPNSEEPVISGKIISLLDIPTTILRNEGISFPREYEGESIFQSKRDYAISETVVPCVNELPVKNIQELFKAKFNDFIYSIRDKDYAIVYDKEQKYRFFNRKDDAREREEIQITNSNLLNLLGCLKEHQSHKRGISSTDIERDRIKERITNLRESGRL